LTTDSAEAIESKILECEKKLKHHLQDTQENCIQFYIKAPIFTQERTGSVATDEEK
jgi:hypothetical protein